MSRLSRYKESLNRFIKNRSCLFGSGEQDNVSIIYEQIKNNDLTLPIMFLTLMNGQSKKYKISIQGYYIAVSIEFLLVYLSIIEDPTFETKYSKDIKYKVLQHLVVSANHSLGQNLNSIKDNAGDKSLDICVGTIKLYNELININTLFRDYKIKLLDEPLKTDIDKAYFKDKQDCLDKLKTFSSIDKNDLLLYLNNRIGCIVDLAISLGWTIGGGNKKELKKTKKLVKHLMMIYKIAQDFVNINDDIMRHEGFTTNLVINWGIIQSYDLFMTNKEKFIESAMILEIYSNTINEIVVFLQQKVDEVMEDSSPELKSSHSTLMTSTSIFR